MNIICKILILLIKGYRKSISPLLGNNCRFHPTCSEYAIVSLERYGILKGGLLAIGRLVRCNPFGGFGIDFVPEKKVQGD